MTETPAEPLSAEEEAELRGWQTADPDGPIRRLLATLDAERMEHEETREALNTVREAATRDSAGAALVWLIERGQPEGLHSAEWWGVTDSRTGAYGWVDSAFSADQFDTRAEAETEIARHDLPNHPFRARAVQHGFIPAARDSAGLDEMANPCLCGHRDSQHGNADPECTVKDCRCVAYRDGPPDLAATGWTQADDERWVRRNVATLDAARDSAGAVDHDLPEERPTRQGHVRTPEGPDDYCTGCGEFWPCSFEQGWSAARDSAGAGLDEAWADRRTVPLATPSSAPEQPHTAAAADGPRARNGAPHVLAVPNPHGEVRESAVGWHPYPDPVPGGAPQAVVLDPDVAGRRQPETTEPSPAAPFVEVGR